MANLLSYLKIFVIISSVSTAYGFSVQKISSNSNSCQDYVQITSTWTGNMAGSLDLPVENNMKTYSISVTTDIPLTYLQLWNADSSPNSGTGFTITPKSWFSGQNAGSLLILGFQISFSGDKMPTFTSISMDDGTTVTSVCSNSYPTDAPTTVAPTTAAQTTAAPTTAAQTTAAPTTAAQTTAAPTTVAPTTATPTTAAQTTAAPTTSASTAAAQTTAEPTTSAPTTAAPTTAAPTTAAATTAAPSTAAPTTAPPTTAAATTAAPTTVASTTSAETPSPSMPMKKIVCYYPNWPFYRPGLGKYSVRDIDPTLCTHFIYSFAVLNQNSLIMEVFDTWVDLDLGGFRQFVSLKNQYPEKKFLIALGGWNDSRTNKYANLLKDASKRAKFVAEAVKFLQEYGFDGLDLDYEYPAFEQDASEKQTFAAWCKELKEAFEPFGYELTAAVAAGKDKIDAGYDVPEISKYLDAIHIMSYDLHGSWEDTVNHHAPMTVEDPEDFLTVDYAVKYWLELGCPKEKLIVGIPTYARTFTLSDPARTDIGAPARGPGNMGPVTGAEGFLGYQEVCMLLAEGGWTVSEVTDGSRGPYAYKGNQWIGYDDVQTAKQKAQYVLDNDLGGAMFWDLPSDDFNSRCLTGRYPIISAVYDTLTANQK